jgi:type I restriction enzyme S subunit
VPEGWEVVKVKQIATENKLKNKDGSEGNILSLSYGRIIRKLNPNAGLTPADYSTYSIVDDGMIVLRLTDLQNDHRSLRTGIVNERGIITSAYVSLKPKGVCPKYLHLALHVWDVFKIFYSMGDGLRQTMNFADVAKIPIPLPPLSEQKEIVEYIERKTAKIDELAQKLEDEVKKLKEFRERLVADVVTGQRKVV